MGPPPRARRGDAQGQGRHRGPHQCAARLRLRRFSVDGDEWVRFDIHPDERSGAGSATVECPVADWRTVRSSSGHSERRPVIRTVVEVVQQSVLTEVTLTYRDEMGFRMLLGRAAVRRRFVVDPGRSYFGGRHRPTPGPA